MKVRIDGELCTGHGRCAHYGPEVYRLDENGYNLDCEKVIDVAAGLERQATLGMKSCPERAILPVEDAVADVGASGDSL